MFKLKHSFNELMELITTKGRNGQKRLDNNTYAFLNRMTGCIDLRYLNHTILVVRPDNSFIVSHHGWPISDVRELINKYTNLGIHLKRGVWYLENGQAFYNDMLISPKMSQRGNEPNL